MSKLGEHSRVPVPGDRVKVVKTGTVRSVTRYEVEVDGVVHELTSKALELVEDE